jgi:hypothetical protein
MINNNNNFLKIFLIILGAILLSHHLFSRNLTKNNKQPWGFYAHKKINSLAIFTLKSPLNLFFRRHLKEIEDFAVLPDQRRYIMDEEASRHYIDLDRYSIDSIKNSNWTEISQKIHTDTVKKHGIVVWHIPLVYKKLVYSFIKKDTVQIIKLAAELGHYVADAHVPLHTSSNYDGQKTNQNGLHSFWESRIPEIYQTELEDWCGPAEYIPNVQQNVWNWVLSSHQYVDILLFEEKKLSEKFKPSEKYSFEQKGNTLVKNYSLKYAKAYHKALNSQVENRFSLSIKHIGDLWYSAWIEAGQPNLE